MWRWRRACVCSSSAAGLAVPDLLWIECCADCRPVLGDVALLASIDACRVAGAGLAPRDWFGAPCAPNTASPCSSARSGSLHKRLAQPRKSPRPAPATRPAAVLHVCCAAGAAWVLGLLLGCCLLLEELLRRPGLARLPRGSGHCGISHPTDSTDDLMDISFTAKA